MPHDCFRKNRITIKELSESRWLLTPRKGVIKVFGHCLGVKVEGLQNILSDILFLFNFEILLEQGF